MSKTLVLASGNKGKILEFQALFESLNISVKAQSDYQVPEADETGLSFIENAIIKARNAAHYSGLPALADDSGIAVDKLLGRPGIFSARYAGSAASDQENIEKLLLELKDAGDSERNASFICALAFVRHAKDPVPIIAMGRWEGRILNTSKGEGGFGYDPVFWCPEHNCAAAELAKLEKNKISHRAKAMASLMTQIQQTSIW